MRQRKYSHSCFWKQTQRTVLGCSRQKKQKAQYLYVIAVSNSRPGKVANKVHPAFKTWVAKVHFCISEHTNPSACSNSLQLSLRQLMTTAQQQHCLISNVFLNLGCQGSLVGGCLLYFSYKKKCFFPPQTMTNPKTKKEGAPPAIVVKAAVSLLWTFLMVSVLLLPVIDLL